MKDSIDRCSKHRASVSHDQFGKALECRCGSNGKKGIGQPRPVWEGFGVPLWLQWKEGKYTLITWVQRLILKFVLGLLSPMMFAI